MNKKTLQIITLSLTLILFSSFNLPNVWAVADEEGSSDGASIIEERRTNDNDQISAEAEELARLQEEDRKACEEEEASEYGISQSEDNNGQGRDTDPNSPDNPDSPFHNPGQDPDGDDDGDGIPNDQDEDDDGNGIPDSDEDPTEDVPPVCDQGRLAAYITSNEGWRNVRYPDSGGYSIGIGHFITGNEPSDINQAIQETGEITDDQVKRLFSVDLQTHKNVATRLASEREVDWSSLSEGRQIVLVDMAYTLGYPSFNKFNDTWAAIRDAQDASGDEEALAWREVAQHIRASDYYTDVKSRGVRNAKIMETLKTDDQLEIIDAKIDSDPRASNMCGGSMAILNPFKLFSELFQTPLALAQGLYVPVVEQDGQLMRDTENIRKDTKKIEDHTDKTRILSIQICTHLRAIRRIQSRFEQKMVEDAQTKKIRSTELEKYRQAVFGDDGIIKSGYNASVNEDEEGFPLFVTNEQNYVKDASNEGAMVGLDTLAKNNNINNSAVFEGIFTEDSFGFNSGQNKDDIQNVLGSKAENNEVVAKNNTSLGQNLFNHTPILSTLLKPVRKTLAWLTGNEVFAAPATEDNSNETVNSNDFWGSFLRLVERNPSVTYLRYNDYLEQKRNESILAARDTALQGQGFLPVRNCLAKTSDGKNCAVWGTIQPGIIVKEVTGKAVNTRVDTYIQAREAGDITAGNEPNIQEILENRPTGGGGGAIGPGMTTPDSIPDNSEDMGSEGDTNTGGGGGNTGGREGNAESGNIWDQLIATLGGLFDNGDNVDEESFVDLRAIIEELKAILGTIWDILRPLIAFDSKERDGGKLIYWFSPNAYNCYADNDWLSVGIEGGIAKGKGERLISERSGDGLLAGSLNVIPPSANTKYKIKCENSNGSRTKDISI